MSPLISEVRWRLADPDLADVHRLPGSGVIRRRQLVNGLDHRKRALGRNVRMDAVPEIEHVTVTRPVAREYLGDPVADLGRGRMKHTGVQVTLQRHTIRADATR